MTAHLHPDDPRMVICDTCKTERYEPNPALAQRLVTEHNHTKHKEN